jgi:hypothetical protein
MTRSVQEREKARRLRRQGMPYGVCSLRVNSTWMVQHIYGAIQEYGGFDEPAWLDSLGPGAAPSAHR